MKGRPAGKLTANLAAMVLGTALAFLLGEGAVRLSWDDAPAGPAQPDSLPLETVPEPDVIYRLAAGASGHYNGTEIHLNSMGLRDRDYPIPRPPGRARLLVLGDSMVFGVGLPPEATLPGRLSELLAPAEVINAGVFGYNLTQEISLLRDVGLKYQPDVVVSCFVHNDIENWGLGRGGGVPEILSTRFTPPPRDAWSTKLADLMLPGTFDPDRLNLLPREDAAGLRARFASMSRLYLFVYLRLRTHSWNLSAGEIREPLIDSPACQAEETIWSPLREGYRRLRRTVEGAGARLVVVIQGGLWWEGRPLQRLGEILREEGIPYLDLTPVWLDRQFYAREYSLGWDPHPNARANRLAAELVAEFLRRTGMVPGGPAPGAAGSPGPHDVIAAREDLRDRLSEWSRRQDDLVMQERASWAGKARLFSPVVDLALPAPQVQPDQTLYGFWDAATGPFQNGPKGRWMSAVGGVLLKRPPGAVRLLIEVVLPESAAALGHTPATLHVCLGAPPGRCRVQVLDVPLDRLPAAAGPGGLVSAELELPDSLPAGETVEVDLSVDQPFQATYLNPQTRDPRLVSFLVKRIALD
ncbi:MAG TPA: GDSL-type esterase/lipase family protein [Candidatus Polarisedimenticolia bacterium]|jgi:lysophospholipase L1-like esterase